MPVNKVIAISVSSIFLMGCASTSAVLGPSSRAVEIGPDPVVQCITRTMAQQEFSGVISVTGPGSNFTLTHGHMAGPDSAAMTHDAQFNLGSANKMFTAVAIGQLIEAGKVSLDDPIGRYVTGLTEEAAAVSVQQLLTHSSGLGSFFNPYNMPAIQGARGLSDLKPLILNERPRFSPGQRFAYSNTGFLLLGLLIEQVSGQSYGVYLDTHIFTPAGMRSSGLDPDALPRRAIGMTRMPPMQLPSPNGNTSGAAAGPAQSPQPGPQPGPPPGPGGMMISNGPLRPSPDAAIRGNSAGGGYSNVTDMAAFYQAFQQGRLTSPAMRDQLTAPHITAMPARDGRPAESYGYGFFMGHVGDHAWYGHGGGALGVNVESRYYKDDQTTIVIMSNRDPMAAMDLLRAVQPLVLDGAACPVEGS